MPPLLVPVYIGEPGRSSLQAEADLVPQKPTTDILLSAQAFAPSGQSVRSVLVSARVGPVYKELVVHGPRCYRSGLWGLSLTSAETFQIQPITYEWAYGGTDAAGSNPARWAMDPRNPVGKGVAIHHRDLDGRPAHCIELPKGNPAEVGPAGFGPLAAYWSPRRELAGSYDERWEQSRRPLLPADYDERHLLCAPANQRPASHLTGGEPVELMNLSKVAIWRFQLPRIALDFETRIGTKHIRHEGRLGTVVVEPDLTRLTLVWQASLRIEGPQVDYLDYTTVNAHGEWR